MKKLGLYVVVLLFSVMFLAAFTSIKTGGIMGNINPVNAAESASLIAGTDTIKATIVQGRFTFSNLREGVYSISIKAKAPYRDTIIEKVAVKDSATTDLGEIKLQQ